MQHNIPDHPVIRNMEATGCPDGKEPEMPCCPVCDRECEKIYKHTESGENVGCDNCIVDLDPLEVEDL